jgi:hypothetical protein
VIYPLMSQTEMTGEAEFKCNRMNAAVATATCLEWYVDHNALMRKDSPCFKCMQGQSNREQFAKS